MLNPELDKFRADLRQAATAVREHAIITIELAQKLRASQVTNDEIATIAAMGAIGASSALELLGRLADIVDELLDNHS